jgi:large subunit ribosomal protein L46
MFNHILSIIILTKIQAASRILEQAAGVDMNSWIVGNHPVGHFKLPYSEQQVKLNDQGHHQGGDIVFFMKGRILAGQANLIQNSLGAKDFKWLTKEEIQPIVRPKYWKSIQDVLPER